MTRILHIINDIEQGGAEHVVLNLVRHRDRAAFEHTIAYFSGRPELAAALQDAGAEVLPPIGLHGVADLPRALISLLRMVRRRRPAIVHTHLLRAEILGAAVARLLGVPGVIGTVHHEFWDDARYPAPVRHAYVRSVRHLNHATAAISQSVRNKLIRDGVPADRVQVIVNGIDAVSPLSRAEARRALGLDEGLLVAGAIGNLYAYKGHDLLLAALGALASHHPTLHVVVIGEGEERPALLAQALRLGVSARVHLVGRRPRAATLLSAFDVFVQPSRTEGLGLALLEAMHAGVPAIARAVGGIPEVVGSGGAAILVPPEPPGGIAEALDRLLKQPGQLRQLADLGRARAARFDAAGMTATYERLYRQLLARPP